MEKNRPRIAVGTPPADLHQCVAQAIAAAGGWLAFDRFMALALYAPGMGYYARSSDQFGSMPASGSDFVTAPHMSPVFGRLLAVQLAEAMRHTDTCEIWEFGAGSGALAQELLAALDALGAAPQRYCIVDLSAALRARQQQRLAPWGTRVCWVNALPARMHGIVIGNELLDAMPVQLLLRKNGVWHERGVVQNPDGALDWHDRPTALRPPHEPEGTHDYLCEIHPQAQAFIRTLGAHLVRGAAFFIDYGFGEAEYYHPQRHMGTLMCHRQHRADGDPLRDVGAKDISAHVNFTAVAVAAQDAGFELLGYTTQAHFLINCGLQSALDALALAQRATAAKLVMEHEMGELFKVIGLVKGAQPWQARGFCRGSRLDRL